MGGLNLLKFSKFSEFSSPETCVSGNSVPTEFNHGCYGPMGIFLENGEIVSTKSRKASENRKWFAKQGDLIKGKTVIVLINYGSASASEIVAGALKDHKRAILIGQNTYGKGSVQSIIPLKNDGAIRLTVSKYYLPSGESISDIGVAPDIEVTESSDEFRIDTETDNQLNFAIKLLNG